MAFSRTLTGGTGRDVLHHPKGLPWKDPSKENLAEAIRKWKCNELEKKKMKGT